MYSRMTGRQPLQTPSLIKVVFLEERISGCYCLFLYVLAISTNVKETAGNVDEVVREFSVVNKILEDLWANHSNVVQPKAHRWGNSS
ncbi:hypothetical protein Nepgr_032778 [Nepenthes gracilis]|uniref:Uncharacterized protein n=1 Tax=Nepenthes gracilis TaxID=150966 RepID=A0AAD3TJA2_NEPGR|nr:hypothetical protein Nepgr_032778 [Nepenthes gracilis]